MILNEDLSDLMKPRVILTNTLEGKSLGLKGMNYGS
jgi:hypothetical protein